MNAVALQTRGYISPAGKTQVIHIPGAGAGETAQLLVKALELPLPKSMTEAIGIHQSDIIIRTAIMAAIADIRANPWLLDTVFASLAHDTLTLKEYGENEITQAKKWFLKTDIPVFMNTRVDEAKLPAISIKLIESVETEATMGDVHYIPMETAESEWPVLAGPFAPLAYNAGSGIMKLPQSILDDIVLAPGMILVDRVGGQHPVLEVLDNDVVSIAAGTIADFGVTVIKGCKPDLVQTLESLVFRESYSIGLWVQGEPVHLTYLYSVIAFALLRYKEVLLEARGFERSVLAWSDISRNDQFQNELVFNRFCNITGYVRNYWPKTVSKALALETGPILVGNEGSSGVVTADGKKPTGDESWLAETDSLLVKL